MYQIRLGERNPFTIHYEWQIHSLDVDKLKEISTQIIGLHDFASFCKGNPGSTKRTIYDVQVEQTNNQVKITFVGDGFLRHMIRILVYTLVELANGNMDVDIQTIIDEKSRTHTKHMAPASGLYLENIIY